MAMTCITEWCVLHCSQRCRLSVTSRVSDELRPLQPEAEVPLEEQDQQTSCTGRADCWQQCVRITRVCCWVLECVRHVAVAVSNRRHCQFGFGSVTHSTVSRRQGVFYL